MSNAFAGLDLSFRPSATHVPLLLSLVKGKARRRELIKSMEEERLEELPERFLQSALSEEERSAFAALHPGMMGGEYLPDLRKGEVEVARIELASNTADVISIRMRPTKKGLEYRVVDEYGSGGDDEDDFVEGESMVDSTRFVSKLPLTLGQLGEFAVEHARVEDIILLNEFYTVDEALDFFKGSSVYYPEFDLYLEAYIAGVMPGEEEDEEDDGDDVEDEE